MRHLVFFLFALGFWGCGPQGQSVRQESSAVAEVDTHRQARETSRTAIQNDSAPAAQTEPQTQLNAFLAFKAQYLADFGRRITGPIPFDSLFITTPRLDTLWASVNTNNKYQIKSTGMGDTLEFLCRDTEGAYMGQTSLTNIRINNQLVNTWPATAGWSVNQWTKFYLHGKPWWAFHLWVSACNGSSCRANKLMFIDSNSNLYFTEVMEGAFTYHPFNPNSPPNGHYIHYGNFVIVNYNNDSLPDYFTASGPDRLYYHLAPTSWFLSAYSVNKNYPRKFSGAGCSIRFITYLSFDNHYSYAQGDSVVVVR